RAGDAVVAVDGESVDSGLSLTAQIRERSVGAQVTLSVVRDGKRQDMTVTLGELPVP
ncbi:MAG: PDZ domain-containing protein, partial [Dermatophilaceae bacterium]